GILDQDPVPRVRLARVVVHLHEEGAEDLYAVGIRALGAVAGVPEDPALGARRRLDAGIDVPAAVVVGDLHAGRVGDAGADPVAVKPVVHDHQAVRSRAGDAALREAG